MKRIAIYDPNNAFRMQVVKKIESEIKDAAIVDFSGQGLLYKNLIENDYEIVIIEYNCEFNRSMEFIKNIKNNFPNIKIIFSFYTQDKELSESARNNGADISLSNPKGLEDYVNAINYFIGLQIDHNISKSALKVA
jgi:DNA-binding NarL/FixJ family response regulator